MRFVVIASARTGSNHLVTQLGRERDIWCHGEVFHPNKVFVRWPGWPHVAAPEDVEIELRALRAADPENFLARVYALGFGRQHVGFKIFEYHHPMLAKIIADPEIAKIVLIRTNVLANYASQLVAQEAGVWGVINQERRAAVLPIRFNTSEFLKYHDSYMSFYAKMLAQLNASGQIYQLIRYDELNNPILLAKLTRFLGATSAPGPSPAPEPVRGSSNIVSRFSNSDEVLQFLRVHGRLEWMHEGEIAFAALTGGSKSGH